MSKKLNFIIKNKNDPVSIYFIEYFEEILNDLKMDLKSKKQIIIFLDSIERGNFEANYISNSLKIYIDHKISYLDYMGILINDFIKLKIKDDNLFFSQSDMDDYSNNLEDLEEKNIFEISISKFLNYIEKFSEKNDKGYFHVDDLEEFFDHHSEKIRFHINSLMDFFDIVNKYKELYKKKTKNYNLESKIGDNLFFKFVSDLLHFSDMEIEERLVSIINIHNIYINIQIKKQSEILFRDFFLISKQNELPENLLDKKIFIDLENYEYISFGKIKEKNIVNFEKNEILNYNNDFLDFENLKNTVNQNFTEKFQITIDKKNIVENKDLNDNRHYFEDIKNKTQKSSNLNWNYYRNNSLDNLYTPSHYKNFNKQEIVKNKNFIKENINYTINKNQNFIQLNEEKKFIKPKYERNYKESNNREFKEYNYKDKYEDINRKNFTEKKYDKNYINGDKNFVEKNLHYSLNKYKNDNNVNNINKEEKYFEKNLKYLTYKNNNNEYDKINNNNHFKKAIPDLFEETENNYINNLKRFENALKTEVINSKLKNKNLSQNNFYINALNKIKKEYKDVDYLKNIDDPNEVIYITYDTIVDKLKEEERILIQKKNLESFMV